MKKTKEEIAEAVLDECARVWKLRTTSEPNTTWNAEDNPKNFIEGLHPICVTRGNNDYWFISPSIGFGMSFAPLALSRNLLPSHVHWMMAYRLLGLETRDAVAEAAQQHATDNNVKLQMQRKISELNQRIAEISNCDEIESRLQAERSRSERLVKAITKIQEGNKRHKWPYWDAGEVANDIGEMMETIDRALAAYKEGGKA
jgi:hypothetical protein